MRQLSTASGNGRETCGKCHPPFNILQQLNRCTRIRRDEEKGQFQAESVLWMLQLVSCVWHFKVCLVDAFARTWMAFIVF